MPLSLTDVKQVILLEVGAGLLGLPDRVQAAALDKITPYIDIYWDLWASKSYWPNLQKAHVKRQCLEIMLGQVADRMTTVIGGLTINQDQLTQHYSKMLEEAKSEVERLEKEAAASRLPQLQAIASNFQADAYGRLYNPLAPMVRRDTWRFTQ